MNGVVPALRMLSVFVLAAVMLLILINIFQRDVGPPGSNISVLVPYPFAAASFVLAIGSAVAALILARRRPGPSIGLMAASLILAVSGSREFLYSWEASEATDIYGLVARKHDKVTEDACLEVGGLYFTIRDKNSSFSVFRGIYPFSLRKEDLVSSLMLKACS